MKNLKISKIILVVLLVAAMLSVCTRVFALDTLDIETSYGDTNSESGLGGLVLEPTNTTTETKTNTTTETKTNTTTNTTAPTAQTPVATKTGTDESKLPNTGDAEDFIVFALVAVFIIVSFVAYKKMKEYKNI